MDLENILGADASIHLQEVQPGGTRAFVALDADPDEASATGDVGDPPLVWAFRPHRYLISLYEVNDNFVHGGDSYSYRSPHPVKGKGIEQDKLLHLVNFVNTMY
jgi:hypothetical protein